MKLIAKYPKLFTSASIYVATIIRVLLNILLLVIIAALIVGVYKSGNDLIHSLHEPLEYILQRILLDIVFIAALVELSITILGYLKDGRVHVRYIIDTIFIIMLNEVVSLWFKKPTFAQVGGICLTIAVLALVRISVVKFDFNNND
ncbi:MAG: phosphate-starvation-inducible PsiE family protein [Candidatus Saccharimonadales bacterium]